MSGKLSPVFSRRFLMFCTVGASGVGVNLAVLALLADLVGVQANLASAVAIAVSINTNFLVNELWTFRDRGGGTQGWGARWARFHVVSLVGAAIQWSVFVTANVGWLLIVGDGAEQYFQGDGGWFATHVVRPIADPPDVGAFKYFSQMIGIGAATVWNYLANFYWTWAARDREIGDA